MTIEYSNWLVDKIVDKEANMVAMRKQFRRVNEKDMMMTTMKLKETTRMSKHLAQKKSMINQKRKDRRQSDLLIFGFEHVDLKVDVKNLMFRNYLAFAGYGFCLRCRLLGFHYYYYYYYYFFMVWFRV